VLPDLAPAVKALLAVGTAIAAALGGTAPGTPAGSSQSTKAGAGSTRAAAPKQTASGAPTTKAPATWAGAAGTAKGAVVRGKATHYGPASNGGNCSYPTVPANKMTVAAGPDLYANGAGCGGYLDVTSGNRTIRVKIDNRCPECGPGHIDLTDEAFAALAPLVKGLIPITYRVVTNPKPAPALSFRVKEGSSRYWLGLLVDGTGNRLRSVEVRAGSSWRSLQRTDYGYWLAPSGAGPGPLSVRVTDVAGHRATATGIRIAPGAVQRTGVRLYR
jgi:expansin (peptidoglycan-binding protein)